MSSHIRWEDKVDEIKDLVKDGMTVAEVGGHFNISRMRMYQVFTQYGIPTPKRKREAVLKNQPPEVYSLYKLLVAKTLPNKYELLSVLTPVPTHCPVLGIELDYTSKPNGDRQDNSPSIDRVDSGKGYTLDNVVIMSWKANRIKNNGGWQDHQKIADFIKNFEKL